MRVQPKLTRNNHLLSTADLSGEEIRNILYLMGLLKDAHKQGIQLPLLKDKVLGMIFEINSTRTRISFEVGMHELGGHALYLKPGEIHLGQRENIKDTSRVISRMACSRLQPSTCTPWSSRALATTLSSHLWWISR